MYGFILRLDAGRQKRVGTEPLKKLLSDAAYQSVLKNETRLNAGRDIQSPFAPTIIRPEFYPAFLRATDVRSIFWKVKNASDFHDLVRAYIDTDSTMVFEFKNTVSKELAIALCEFLEHCDHLELQFKDMSGKKVKFNITNLEDSCMEDEQPVDEQ